MITSTSEQIVHSYFDAVNNTQLDDLAALFTEDASLYYPLSDPVVGRSAIGSFYEGILQLFLKHFDHATRLFFNEKGGVAVEIHFIGTMVTGKEVIFDAVDLFTISKGKIQKLQIFFDTAKVVEMMETQK